MQRTFSPQSRSLVLFGVSLGLGLIFHWFFFEKIPGISMPLFIGILAVALPLVAGVWGVRVPRSAWMALLGAVFFAAWVAVRTNPLLSVLNTVFSLYLTGMAVLLTAERFDWDRLLSFVRIPFLPIAFVAKIPWSMGRMTELRGRGDGTGSAGQVIRGIVMALPVLVLFILLFASADLVIREYLLGIFHINVETLPEMIGRTVMILAFSLFASGTLGYALSGAPGAREGAAKREYGKLGTLQTSVFLGAIALLFFGFILVQATYLFGGESALLGRNFTYAEYARRGFFELLAVALITFLLLWVSERSVARTGAKHSRQFQVIGGALVVEVILIIASAYLRLSLYESAFGFTTLRLWSHAFIVLLTVLFAMFAWKMWRNGSERSFLVPAFLAAALSLAIMNVLNPDVFIARKNIERFAGNRQFDASHIASLSDDATREQLAVLDSLEGEEKARFGQMLAFRYERRLRLAEDGSWLSWNYARRRADAMLRARHEAFQEYKGYFPEMPGAPLPPIVIDR